MKLAAATVLALGMVAATPLPVLTQRGAASAQVSSNRSAPDTSRLRAMLVIEDRRDPTPDELQRLIDQARAGTGREEDTTAVRLRRQAVRTLGRLERRDLIPTLVGFLPDPQVRDEAELGVLLTLRAHASAGGDSAIDDVVDDLVKQLASPVLLGQLPYSRRDQFEAAEGRLRQMLREGRGARVHAARGLEALVRRNRRIGTLSAETVSALTKGATSDLPDIDKTSDQAIAFYSIAALVAGGVVDQSIVSAAFRAESSETRRLGALALYASADGLPASARTGLVRQALKDRAASVRYDALRAWMRHESQTQGCGPVIDALADPSEHIVLAAIDGLADQCPADVSITERLIGELRTPPTNGRWHREAHALVAAARRVPDRAATALPLFVAHETWQVRMYAARAAALLKDSETLARLAHDVHDNVREAAVPLLRTMTPDESMDEAIAALGRRDYQLLRTVAGSLKGAAQNRQLVDALVSTLERVTAEKKETSRDTRMALIERIVELGGPEQATVFERLLADYDDRIAVAAAAALEKITGRSAIATPRPLVRPPLPTAAELDDNLVARVTLDNGRFFDIVLDRINAPLSVTRFVRLVRSRYYDGLTFHRMVANFVIQGGSPGANEYAGDAQFMRDELSAVTHAPGTVGISTRGRHTGDAQLFVNLVDNRRLDFDYTVIGQVVKVDVLETVMEGTTIRTIRMVAPKAGGV
jgi:cyclophilin family peptidyl-prolyl cis-trans isomerase/HEAT repeat protein